MGGQREKGGKKRRKTSNYLFPCVRSIPSGYLECWAEDCALEGAAPGHGLVGVQGRRWSNTVHLANNKLLSVVI